MAASVGVPQTDGAVKTATKDCFSIRAEGYSGDQIRVSFKRAEKVTRVCVPQMNGHFTTTGNSFSIPTERDAVDPTLMANYGADKVGGICIPKTGGGIHTTTGDCFSIRAECDADDMIRMS